MPSPAAMPAIGPSPGRRRHLRRRSGRGGLRGRRRRRRARRHGALHADGTAAADPTRVGGIGNERRRRREGECESEGERSHDVSLTAWAVGGGSYGRAMTLGRMCGATAAMQVSMRSCDGGALTVWRGSCETRAPCGIRRPAFSGRSIHEPMEDDHAQAFAFQGPCRRLARARLIRR